MENESSLLKERKEKVEELVKCLFDNEYSPSQIAETVIYFVNRFCELILNREIKNHLSNTTANFSIPTLFEEEYKNLIKEEFTDSANLVLEQDLRKVPYFMRSILTCLLSEFLLHVHGNYFVQSYFKGMMVHFCDKLNSINSYGQPAKYQLLFIVKGVLRDVLEDTYIGMMNYEKSLFSEAEVAPEN